MAVWFGWTHCRCLLLHEIGGGVEVGNHFALVRVEALLDFVQLTLGATGGGIGRQQRRRQRRGGAGIRGQRLRIRRDQRIEGAQLLIQFQPAALQHGGVGRRQGGAQQ